MFLEKCMRKEMCCQMLTSSKRCLLQGHNESQNRILDIHSEKVLSLWNLANPLETCINLAFSGHSPELAAWYFNLSCT